MSAGEGRKLKAGCEGLQREQQTGEAGSPQRVQPAPGKHFSLSETDLT